MHTIALYRFQQPRNLPQRRPSAAGSPVWRVSVAAVHVAVYFLCHCGQISVPVVVYLTCMLRFAFRVCWSMFSKSVAVCFPCLLWSNSHVNFSFFFFSQSRFMLRVSCGLFSMPVAVYFPCQLQSNFHVNCNLLSMSVAAHFPSLLRSVFWVSCIIISVPIAVYFLCLLQSNFLSVAV